MRFYVGAMALEITGLNLFGGILLNFAFCISGEIAEDFDGQ
jgi:hypothetical protein